VGFGVAAPFEAALALPAGAGWVVRDMVRKSMLVGGLALFIVAVSYAAAFAARGSGGSGNGGKKCHVSVEICDGKDNDCDGLVDEGGVCAVSYYCDADLDGYPSAVISGTCSSYRCTPAGCGTNPGTDCDDANAFVNPAAVENCDADGVDNDCDGTIDECDPCANGVRDGAETGVDCGGSCAGCDIGYPCNTGADCLSGYCAAGVCAQPPVTLPPDCNAIKYDNTTFANHVNLILVPSGFNGDMALFQQKAQWIASIFGSHTPFDNSIPQYSVFYVPKEAGDYCYFNCQGIARLLCCDTSLARTLSSTCTTGARQTIVVENSDTYGGAGYYSSDVATTSTNSSAPLVAVHELGHSLFDLGDEYSYGSSTASSPNCDYAGCAKWQDMLGYKGVSCTAGNCANGAYFVSETTIMKALGYPFEEVNLRLSCCTYVRETGAFPTYCDQFKQFTTTGDLNEFCQNPTSAGTAAVPADYVNDPEEVTFSRDPDSGAWRVESAVRRRPGFYPTVETRGDAAGSIRVDVGFAGGQTQQMRFSSLEDVEFPGEGDGLGGTLQMRRNSVSVVIDRKGRGPITSIAAHEEADPGSR
jgi:hypothetical protein